MEAASVLAPDQPEIKEAVATARHALERMGAKALLGLLDEACRRRPGDDAVRESSRRQAPDVSVPTP
jgi:hypothetical protein